MPRDILSNAERQIARCQSERPDIYDVHYDAIEQWKAAHARAALSKQRPEICLIHGSQLCRAQVVRQ